MLDFAIFRNSAFMAGVPHLAWMVAGLSLTGLGLGAVMAVASSAIIGNVDPRKLGMPSSVEGVSFEFGSLLAVAVLGSLLAALFSSGIQLPQGASAAARERMTEALVIASRGGACREQPDSAQIGFAV